MGQAVRAGVLSAGRKAADEKQDESRDGFHGGILTVNCRGEAQILTLELSAVKLFLHGKGGRSKKMKSSDSHIREVAEA